MAPRKRRRARPSTQPAHAGTPRSPYLLRSQNTDGGWGGHAGVPSSIEETGVAVSALSAVAQARPDRHLDEACERGARWLAAATLDAPIAAAPVGLYFARLWYYEDLYPVVFALAGLAAARHVTPREVTSRA